MSDQKPNGTVAKKDGGSIKKVKDQSKKDTKTDKKEQKMEEKKDDYKKSSLDDVTKDQLVSEQDKKVNDKDKALEKKVEYYTKEDLDKFDMKAFIKAHLMKKQGKFPYNKKDLHIVLDKAKEVFTKSPTLIEVKAPVNVCGDIHGQFGDLLRIFNACGLPFKSRYLFLGDYVDRGHHSLEVIVLLLCCRIQFPKKTFLLRGNHELANINRVYGFSAEVESHFDNKLQARPVYDHFNDVFSMMPLAALISGRILCMHGGLSPRLKSLDDIRKIQRPLRVVRELAQDLLWADPDPNVKGFQPNTIRAVSHLFGEDAVADKCRELDIDMVIRAHQVVEFGYAFFAKRTLITVFSAARYNNELLNFAAVVQVSDILEISFVQLRPTDFENLRNNEEKKRDTTGDNEGGEK